MQSHIRKVHAYLAVTYHLHFWQNDRDLLRATAVTRGCREGIPQFRLRVRRSNQSYPRSLCGWQDVETQSLFHSALRRPCFCHHFGFGGQDFILSGVFALPHRWSSPPAPRLRYPVVFSHCPKCFPTPLPLPTHSPPKQQLVSVLITSVCLHCGGKRVDVEQTKQPTAKGCVAC